MGDQRLAAEGGAASVEQAGLVALIALLLIAAISALASGPPNEQGRALGATIARRRACATPVATIRSSAPTAGRLRASPAPLRRSRWRARGQTARPWCRSTFATAASRAARCRALQPRGCT